MSAHISEELLPNAAASEGTLDSLKRNSSVKGLFEDGGVLLLASVFGNGANYFFMLFLARQLGMEDFGIYALGITLFNTLILLVTTGLDSGAVKFTSERLALGDHSAARRMVVVTWLIATGLGILASVALAIAATPLASGVYGKPELASLLLLLSAAIPFAFTTVLLLSLLQAYQTVRYTVLVKYLWEPLGKWGIAGLALLAGWGLVGVVGGFVVTFVVSAAFAAVALVRMTHLSPRDVTTVQRQDVRTFVGYCFPLLAANVFGVIAPRMDIMLLGYWMTNQDVGLYLVAFQTAAILALVLGSFDVAFAPIMSHAWAGKDTVTFRACYAAVHRMAAMVTIPLFIGVVVFRDEVLALFGRDAGEGAAALWILAIGYLVNTLSGSANTVLLMTGRSRTILVNTIIYGMALVLGTAMLIPLWGIVGAALAASSALISINIIRVWEVWHGHRMFPWTWTTLKPLAAGLAMGAVLWVMKPLVPLIFHLPLAIAGCGVYVIVLILAQVESDDRAMVAATLAKFRLVWD